MDRRTRWRAGIAPRAAGFDEEGEKAKGRGCFNLPAVADFNHLGELMKDTSNERRSRTPSPIPE